MSTKSECYDVENLKLTPDEIKETGEFDDLSEDELEELSLTIYQFAKIILEHYETIGIKQV
jgi:hypothetical protein